MQATLASVYFGAGVEEQAAKARAKKMKYFI
jgi:hypothetical protein